MMKLDGWSIFVILAIIWTLAEIRSDVGILKNNIGVKCDSSAVSR